MIIQTNNQNFKEIIETLKEEGFIINHTSNKDICVCMQKNNIQIDITDLKNYKNTDEKTPKINLRKFLKQQDKKSKAVTKEDILKNIKIDKKDLDELILKMLMDGEIYESKPKSFRWLG